MAVRAQPIETYLAAKPDRDKTFPWGKTALITGASSGIGKGFASSFAADGYDPAFVCSSPSRRPSHSVVGAWIRIVIRMAMKATEAIICAPGAFTPSKRPASAAGITPVSRVQHMNSSSARLHRARRSGSAHARRGGRLSQAASGAEGCQRRGSSAFRRGHFRKR